MQCRSKFKRADACRRVIAPSFPNLEKWMEGPGAVPRRRFSPGLAGEVGRWPRPERWSSAYGVDTPQIKLALFPSYMTITVAMSELASMLKNLRGEQSQQRVADACDVNIRTI